VRQLTLFPGAVGPQEQQDHPPTPEDPRARTPAPAADPGGAAVDLTLLVVAGLVAAALTWWFMNPPRRPAPTEPPRPGPVAEDAAASRPVERPGPAPPRAADDRARRRRVGLAAGVLLVLVVVAVFALAQLR
jgi:hypothetical protein